jgi:hypothetical protein
MTEKPLKVRVAEALGGVVTGGPRWWRVTWPGAAADVPLPAFDTDERLGMRLLTRFRMKLSFDGPWLWVAYLVPSYGEGPTPNLAICHLLLALSESGHLQRLLAEGGATPWIA